MATKPTGNKSQGDFTHTIFKQIANLKYQEKKLSVEPMQKSIYKKDHSRGKMNKNNSENLL